MTTAIRAADLFAGAGGSSTGLLRACAGRGLRCDLLAVNHWDVAVETHSQNHPKARHLCHDLDNVNPRAATGGKLDLLIASPECTHHSTARGGKPCDNQSRSTAWHVVRWADELRPRVVVVENVREFATWGPLGTNGRPLKRRKGETFQAWLQALRSLGYSVSHRVLNAADYGDATTRERLFCVAWRGRRPFLWPEPTHAKAPEHDLFGAGKRPWKAAREVIDWALKGQSIFTRKRPLRPKTLARIEVGLRRFGGAAFLAHLTHQGGARVHGQGGPLPTVTGANRGELALVEPFTVQFKGTAPGQLGSTARRVSGPLATVTAQGGSFGLVEPFIVPYRGERDGQSPRSHGIGEPAPTITGVQGHALVEPFLLQLSQSGSNGQRVRPSSRPLPTITTADDTALLEPFLLSYYGTGGPKSVGDPLDTVTAKDRFGLIELCLEHGVDLLFRMLAPHELAAAHSFAPGYRFCGNRGDVVKQIGNSNPVELSLALAESALDCVAA